MAKSTYTADSISALAWPENVRVRPDMYIGDRGVEGFHHCAYEIIDNSVDENLAGHANKIRIALIDNDTLEVEDNGRGIPVGMHKKENKPAIELVLTKLHAGGKFDTGSYQVSGGLHGVGLSVVNALANFLEVEVYRDGQVHYIRYEKGKKVKSLQVIGKTAKSHTGTLVRFQLDDTIFQTDEFIPEALMARFREIAFLNSGLEIVFENRMERDPDNPDEFVTHIFKYEDGIVEFMTNELNEDKELLFQEPILITGEQEGINAEIVFQYRNTGDDPIIYSYANSIHTKNHGIHVDGFWIAYEKIMQKFAQRLKLDKKGDKINKKTLTFGLTVVINTKIPNAEFKGQTKDKLTEPMETRRIVKEIVETNLSLFFEKNIKLAEKILNKAILELRALREAEKAREGVRSNIRGRKAALSQIAGKLADCSTRRRELRELFIVEGDSAGGSAKQGRDREIQAILPLRGKILNVEKKIDKKAISAILANNEIRTMIAVLGAGYYSNFNIEKLQYHKVIIMTDADVDGSHIQTLLLTFFYRFMPQLIEHGHLYIACPPLYKISSGKTYEYAYTDHEKEQLIKQKFDGKKIEIQRYKGLGEMNPDQLWTTTMDPATRKMLQVTISDIDEAEHLIKILMSDDNKAGDSRKKFILSNVNFVTNIDV